MIEGLAYAVLTTSDMPRAKRFFTDQLGRTTEDEHGELFAQFATREGTGWSIRASLPDAPPAETVLYLQVKDVDGAFATWRERGVDMVNEPHDEPFGRTFAVRDPDGRVLHAFALL